MGCWMGYRKGQLAKTWQVKEMIKGLVYVANLIKVYCR